MTITLDPGKTLDDLLHFALNTALVKVNAIAGSVMMLNHEAEELHIKARLGPPRQRRTTEPVFPVSGNSIASYVVKHKKTYRTGDAQAVPFFATTQPGEPHFKSLLCVPIIDSAGNVYGVVSADNEHENRFTDNDEKTLEEFGRELGGIVAARISVPEALRRITEQLMSETTDGDIERTLHTIADYIRNALGADVVLLYQYDEASDKFIRTRDGSPTTSGELHHSEFMRTPVYQTDFPYQVLKNGKTLFISDVGTQTEEAMSIRSRIIRHGQEHPNRDRFSVREGIKSLVGLPLIRNRPDKNGEFVGVLFVNYRKEHVFNIDEQTALMAFADAAAFAILAARREERSRKEKTGLYYRIDERAYGLLNDREKIGLDFLSHFAGEDSECYVMAIDIRRSTDLMLHATTADLFEEFMAEMEGRLKNAVKANWGIVDKFTGDGLIAHFPAFFAGEDAGLHCLKAASDCHKAFSEVYEVKHHCFQVVLAGVGLGIGIDYGLVHLRITGQELIAVGKPVVYACRFSAVDSGHTVLNQRAADVIRKKHAANVITRNITIHLKHEGDCLATDVSLATTPACLRPPVWLTIME